MIGASTDPPPDPHVSARTHLDRPVSELAHVDYMHLLDWETVGESLKRIRAERLGERIVYFYAVTKGDHLVGVVPARRLIINQPETLIRDILISPVVSVPEHATLRDAFRIMAGRKLLEIGRASCRERGEI